MPKFISLFFLLFPIALLAQKDNFSKKITKVSGDLNKDGLADYVLVSQDTLSDNAPYLLEIYFAESNGHFKGVLSSVKAIDAAFPEGRKGYYNGNAFSDITIKKGILSINNELLRGHYEHKFRYQHNNFELIGFSEVYSDGQGTMGTIEFNLSTGIRIKKTEPYGEDDFPVTKTQKKIIIRPLPNLKDFAPFKTDYF